MSIRFGGNYSGYNPSNLKQGEMKRLKNQNESNIKRAEAAAAKEQNSTAKTQAAPTGQEPIKTLSIEQWQEIMNIKIETPKKASGDRTGAKPVKQVFFNESEATKPSEPEKSEGTKKTTNVSMNDLEKNILSGYTKEELLELGFTEEDIQKYFSNSTIYKKADDGTMEVWQEGKYNVNCEINGKKITTMDDLIQELTYGTAEALWKEIKDGNMTLDDAITQLKEMGVKDIEVQKVEGTDNRYQISYTYLGKEVVWYSEN